ncbi:hypothetical protein [Streptomyces buecherae]|uniref:hypothetical protein n=1 Tax=Streptomyces buecherae TaxID=2763006 RepID=UPI001C27A0DB|nr:hypothetical protein [Streptomyces buecherae]
MAPQAHKDPADAPLSTAASVHHHQHGDYSVQAYNYAVHLNGDHVRNLPIDGRDPAYRASEGERFVEPREPNRLPDAAKILEEHGVVVLCAPVGSGRRTAAVRLLRRTAAPQGLELFDLEPEWAKPGTQCLPVRSAAGYVLDLSDLPDEPPARFGQDLVRHGTALRQQGSFLVVLATPGDWQGTWADATGDIAVRLESPSARGLVKAELDAHGLGDRLDWLTDEKLSPIWEADPSAREACRLAGLIGAAKGREQLKEAVDRFGDWHITVEKLLNKRGAVDGSPSLLSTRVTVWAGALLDGGRRASIVRASDDLLASLGHARGPADVLIDATSSRRLQAAEIEPVGERAHHDRRCQGLPAAILRHLWDEFPTQHDLLTTWAVGVAANRSVPEDDARLASEALLRLAVRRHDRKVLDALATGLTGPRRILAVEALTKAATDAELGRYVRGRLLNWAESSNKEKVDLVVDVCGGPWGQQQPALALTRLGKAAGEQDFGAEKLVSAFQELVRRAPDLVAKTVVQWLKKHGTEAAGKAHRQALGAFLALVSSDTGADLVLASAGDASNREHFVRAWQTLLSTNDAVDPVLDQVDPVLDQLTRWQERFEHDADQRDAVISLLAEVFAPPRLRLRLDRLLVAEGAVVRPFWRDILGLAMQHYSLVRKASEA